MIIMEQQARFALIGCGRISENHLDAIANAPSAKLVAVCDIVEEKAKAAAQAQGLSKWYTDIDDMLTSEEVDVCCVLVPSGLHTEVAIKVAKHKVNVLCEKPLDITKEKMKKMIEACKENGVKLGAIFQRRSFMAAQETKKAIENGTLGKVTMGDAYLKYYRDQAYYDSGDWRGTWELDGGGALMNQGVHGIDLINWMMGGIESVYAHCEKLVWDIDVEDTAVVSVRFKNGALGVIEGSTTAYPGLDTIFQLTGSEGSIMFGDEGFYYWKIKDNKVPQPDVSGSMGGLNCQYNTNNVGHILQVEDMARAVLDDREPLISGEEAMKSVNIILAIYESARTGKEIKMDEFNQ